MLKQKHPFKLLCLSLLLAFALPATALGASGTVTKSTAGNGSADITQAVTQSYAADSTVQLGMIVKLKDKDSTTVEPLTQANIKDMLGVTVQPNDATVTLTPQSSSKQQVYVATQGRYDVLISTQNGPVHIGDYITVSALSGIGMKADNGQIIILGKAAEGFDGTGNVVGSATLKDSAGHDHKVSIGRVAVNLDISHNPLASTATDNVPGFLAKTAVSVAGKPVSAARIYLGIVTLAATALVTGNVLYSGIRSGMIAIGRNPLSKKSIIRSLIQTVVAGLIIFVVGVFGVYLLLKL